ncbi:hypothetical protein BC828DRAFT_373972, partial [Blastocladiella britannica]
MATNDPDTAISETLVTNSMTATGILAAFSLISLCRGIFNANPNLRSKLIQVSTWKRRRESAEPPKRARRANPRDWSLILSTILLLVDGANKLAMLVHYRASGTANFIVYRVMEIMVLHTVTFLIMLAIFLRCLIIVLAMAPLLRRKMMVGMCVPLAVLLVEHKIVYLLGVVEMIQRNASVTDWIQLRITPLWISFQFAVVILAIAGVSTWSVYVAFREPSQLQGSSKHSSALSTSYSLERSVGGGTDPQQSPRSPQTGGMPDSPLATSPKLSTWPLLAKGSSMSRATSIPKSPSTSPAAAAASRRASLNLDPDLHSLERQVSFSFAVLSTFLVFCYVLNLIVTLTVEAQLPVVQGVWLNFLLNVMVATELSFDTLIRWRARHM